MSLNITPSFETQQLGATSNNGARIISLPKANTDSFTKNADGLTAKKIKMPAINYSSVLTPKRIALKSDEKMPHGIDITEAINIRNTLLEKPIGSGNTVIDLLTTKLLLSEAKLAGVDTQFEHDATPVSPSSHFGDVTEFYMMAESVLKNYDKLDATIKSMLDEPLLTDAHQTKTSNLIRKKYKPLDTNEHKYKSPLIITKLFSLLYDTNVQSKMDSILIDLRRIKRNKNSSKNQSFLAKMNAKMGEAIDGIQRKQRA